MSENHGGCREGGGSARTHLRPVYRRPLASQRTEAQCAQHRRVGRPRRVVGESLLLALLQVVHGAGGPKGARAEQRSPRLQREQEGRTLRQGLCPLGKHARR